MTRLPIASPVATAIASASSEDSSPATTSSRRMSGAGLKKCMPTTRSGRAAPVAIAVTSREEVLVASTASGSRIEERSPNSERLRSRDSGAASITRPQGASSSSEPAGSSRAAAASASAALHRPRSAPLPRFASTCAAPLASASATGSWSRVRAPAMHASWAIPDPMVPAPMTPMTSGTRASLTARYPGTSALIPVSARPMISFWICEVPS